jgi:hypothetical protein
MPDLFRPSTSSFRRLPKDVDARDGRRHDGPRWESVDNYGLDE